MISGIYAIKNIKTNDWYIGQAIDCARRKSQHFYLLKNGNHYNKHLQHSWNKYGEEYFVFEVLFKCSENKLTYYEQILVTHCIQAKFNLCRECVDSRKGIKVSEETRKKMIHAQQMVEYKSSKKLMKIMQKLYEEQEKSKNHSC